MVEETEMLLRRKRQTSCPLGRPPVPLFSLSNSSEEIACLLREFCLCYYQPELEKFVFEKLGVGKGRVWACVYLWLVEEGYIVDDDNIEKYQEYLSENLNEEYIVVREAIGRNLKPIRPHTTLIASLHDPKEAESLTYCHTTKKLIRLCVVVKSRLKEIKASIQEEKQKK